MTKANKESRLFISANFAVIRRDKRALFRDHFKVTRTTVRELIRNNSRELPTSFDNEIRQTDKAKTREGRQAENNTNAPKCLPLNR